MEEKVPLPIKTQVAALFMVIFGISGVLSSILAFPSVLACPACPTYLIFIIPGFFAGLLSVIFGALLFKRKKWVWKSCISLLFLYLLFLGWSITEQHRGIGMSFNIVILLIFKEIGPPILIPLILLLLDRKNFWKVAK
jgi:hypothetical protein